MKTSNEQLNVMVVDDSIVQRDYVVGMCNELGIESVCGAENGLDAIKKLKQLHYDVVFVDLEMPVMDGIELVREIAAQELAKSVIILSAKDPVLILSVGTMAESDGLAVLGTFKKPIQIDQMECSFKRLLHERDNDEHIFNPDELNAEDVHDAIRNKDFQLKYQPKLTVKGLLLKGVEALARWQHPELGHIPPSQFISVAERFGLIGHLTNYLFELALAQKSEWQKYGVNFHLAFNLSPLSLSDKDLADKIASTTEAHNIRPSEIVLEVTENAVAGEISSAIETLAKLRLKGFNIAIDDYGTGFANAQQLSRVPATELKLDRSLIDGVATRPQQQAIVKSTVALAKDLKLDIVAEGVEHEEDYRFLKGLDIELVQGYLFAMPMESEELLNWIKGELKLTRAKHQ